MIATIVVKKTPVKHDKWECACEDVRKGGKERERGREGGREGGKQRKGSRGREEERERGRERDHFTLRSPERFAPASIPVAAGKKTAKTEKKS